MGKVFHEKRKKIKFIVLSAELLAIQNAIQDKETKALFARSVSTTLSEKRYIVRLNEREKIKSINLKLFFPSHKHTVH